MNFQDPFGLCASEKKNDKLSTANTVTDTVSNVIAIVAGALEKNAIPIIPRNDMGTINGLPIQTLDGVKAIAKAGALGTVGTVLLAGSLALGVIDAVNSGYSTNDIAHGLYTLGKDTASILSGYYVAGAVTTGIAVGSDGYATPVAVTGGIIAGTVASGIVNSGLTSLETLIFGK